MVFSCIIVDWDIYRRVDSLLFDDIMKDRGEYVCDGAINSHDGLPYGDRYRCMGTDTTVALIDSYRHFNGIVIVRGNVKQDILTQLDNFGVPQEIREIRNV
ncbi:MAG: hypothetical protein HY512_03495 [Candidatus Aenigmarchaeota archaeon]|nr:hypothetical protein [Candidatus Aenigmarchaeota archaeon]